jgi:hypothetical protein
MATRALSENMSIREVRILLPNRMMEMLEIVTAGPKMETLTVTESNYYGSYGTRALRHAREEKAILQLTDFLGTDTKLHCLRLINVNLSDRAIAALAGATGQNKNFTSLEIHEGFDHSLARAVAFSEALPVRHGLKELKLSGLVDNPRAYEEGENHLMSIIERLAGTSLESLSVLGIHDLSSVFQKRLIRMLEERKHTYKKLEIDTNKPEEFLFQMEIDKVLWADDFLREENHSAEEVFAAIARANEADGDSLNMLFYLIRSSIGKIVR